MPLLNEVNGVPIRDGDDCARLELSMVCGRVVFMPSDEAPAAGVMDMAPGLSNCLNRSISDCDVRPEAGIGMD